MARQTSGGPILTGTSGQTTIAAERPNADLGRRLRGVVERVTGIEPALSAWESKNLAGRNETRCKLLGLTMPAAAP